MKVPVHVSVAMAYAHSLLPSHMNTMPARAMLYAIGLQESRFLYRRQLNGPARSYWQGEMTGGMILVLKHQATAPIAHKICNDMNVPINFQDVYEAIAWNDTLAAVLARLLLYTLPEGLPKRGDPNEGWRQYLKAWRPGIPHRETWDDYYKQAWEIVGGQQPAE